MLRSKNSAGFPLLRKQKLYCYSIFSYQQDESDWPPYRNPEKICVKEIILSKIVRNKLAFLLKLYSFTGVSEDSVYLLQTPILRVIFYCLLLYFKIMSYQSFKKKNNAQKHFYTDHTIMTVMQIFIYLVRNLPIYAESYNYTFYKSQFRYELATRNE